jgi:heptosyltransferase-2
MTQNKKEKFLIVGPAWVGDMVMAQSLFILLKQTYPDSEITVTAPQWTLPILDRMPQVDSHFATDFSHGELALGRRRRLGISLREQGFTSSIVLPNSFKSALLPYFANVPRRIGWRGEWRIPLLNDCRVLDKTKFPKMVERFAALGVPANAARNEFPPRPRLAVDEENVALSLACLDLNPNAKVVAICPGAEFGEAKQWPAQYYAQLSNELIKHGFEVWLFGSANDQEIAAQIESGISSDYRGGLQNLAGRTNLAQAIDLLSLAKVCVSNDSGLMHIAAALDLPIVAIFGSTSPDFTPPLADKVTLLTTDIECRPCFQRQCPLGHLRCLKEILPSTAVSSIAALLGEKLQ